MSNPLDDEDNFVSKIVHLLQLDGATFEASLLAKGKVKIEQVDWSSWNGGTAIYSVLIDIPSETYAQLTSRVENIQKTILTKAAFLLRLTPNHAIGSVILNPDIPYEPDWRDKVFLMPTDELIKEIESQRNLMIAASTGGPRIQEVNNEYKNRQKKITNALKERGLSDPNPYGDLWSWYGKWSSGDLPTYSSRRIYLSDLFQPILNRLATEDRLPGTTTVFSEPIGWAKIDKGIGAARKALEEASDEIGFQQVGLICRETLLNLAQEVFDPQKHPSTDGTDPSSADTKRMLDSYLAFELSSSSNEAARRHAKASLVLANDLTHRRTATFRDAALCAEATTSIINLIAIISGWRDPKRDT